MLMVQINIMAAESLVSKKPRQRSASAKAVRRVRFSYESPERFVYMRVYCSRQAYIEELVW